MEWNKQNIKGLLLVVCGGVAFYCALQNLDVVWGAVRGLLGILAPFLLGGALAFVLNVPMRAIERHLLQNSRRGAKLRRPLALVLTLLAVLGVLALASLVIGPGIADAVMSIIREIPAAFDRLQKQLNGLAESLAAYLPMIQEWLAGVNIDWESLSRRVLEYAQALGSGIVSSGGGFIGGLVSGVSTFVIGLIFSLYLLVSKERLASQFHRLADIVLKPRVRNGVYYVLNTVHRSFSSFIVGQCVEAIILGVLCTLGMTVLRLPYAVVVGVVVGVSALIPVAGAYIGAIVSAILLLMVSPLKAFIFVIFLIILQQVEGNVIYPKVVGRKIGLPGMWVLLAIGVGGGLWGVWGMLIGVPIASVLYQLLLTDVDRRLNRTETPPADRS